jgi:5-methylcytosine-specific restriction protein B
MDKFTWVEIYKEIAGKLKDYKDRQPELINILADLQKRGLPTISLTDKHEKGEEIPLKKIDPFTFFANFNRGVKTENRIEIIKTLKELWGLSSSIPTDFTGIPVVNNQRTWFFGWQKDIGEQDIDVLWELFTQALDNNINPRTFDAALKQRNIKFNITMGLFWINADRYLNLDSVNRSYLENNGIKIHGLPDFQTYVDYTEKTKKLFQKPFFEISHDAWLDKTQKLPDPSPTKPSIRYWLYAPGEQARFWDQYFEKGLMGVGWKELKEDLSGYKTAEALRQRVFEEYGEKGNEIDLKQLRDFLHEIRKGDMVFVKRGIKELVGFGEVTSDYFYDPDQSEYRHLRKAEWRKKGSWMIPDSMKNLPVKTLTELTDSERIKQLLTLIENGAAMKISEETNAYVLDTAAIQYWWLNANPKIWDIVAPPIGMRQTYTSHNAQGNKRKVYQYFKQVKPGDILLGYVASPLRQIVALCRVTKGLYQSTEGEVFEFEKIEQLPEPISLKQLQSVPELGKCEPLINNQGSLFKVRPEEYEIIRTIIDEANEGVSVDVSPAYSLDECVEATGFSVEKIVSWKAAIDRKKQAVFYGPPGTGKTFLSDHLARHIVGGTDGFVECIQFHPAYTYEEFIQGIRPETDEKGNLKFDLKSGRFLEFCSSARQRTGPCVLIIDEINRANLARVFGELMYLLEYREKDIPLAGGLRFSIPDNVRLIGTMNTADRSIALVDFALRRRFAFLELSPEYDVLLAYQHRRNFNADGLVLVLHDVNAAINDKNFHLGISFFLTDNLSRTLEEIWKLEIEPYLEEYFFSQPEAMTTFRWDKIKERLLS